MQCQFIDPFCGQCKQEAIEDKICCKKHAGQICQVCGEQATTFCACDTGGLCCEAPLCQQCGTYGCLDHATAGPVFAIAALIGRGPRCGVFSTLETLAEEAEKIKQIKNCLLQRSAYPTMGKYEEFLSNTSKMSVTSIK